MTIAPLPGHELKGSATLPSKRQTSDFALTRLVLATAYWLRPRRVRHVPPLVGRLIRDSLVRPDPNPSADRIQASPPGLAGVARDLSTPVVLSAMQRGFYPQGHWGNLKWWSPPERAIMRLGDVHVGKRFRRSMRQTAMRVAFDTEFEAVLDGCAAPRRSGLSVQIMSPWVAALGGTVVSRSAYENLLSDLPASDAPTAKWITRFTLAETAAFVSPSPI